MSAGNGRMPRSPAAGSKMEAIDHELTDELVCPYCGHEFGDSWEYFSDDGGQTSRRLKCDECERELFAEVVVDISYTTRKLEQP